MQVQIYNTVKNILGIKSGPAANLVLIEFKDLKISDIEMEQENK